MEIIKLNIIPNGITPICHASQFDIKRKIGIALFDNMDPYNLSGEETVSLSVRKPDKTIITKTLEFEAGNYLEFETTEQMCAIAGENKCEIKISYDDMTIGSLNFIMQVERDPLYKGIQSESEIENLQEQVNTAVAAAVSGQYDSENVIFDSEPTLNNNIPYTVTSDGIKRALNTKADLSALRADNISFDNTGSGLSATDVDEAIKELESDIPEIPSSYAASAVTYDNTQSGLSSNNAQDAIDEVKGDLDGAVSAIGTALSGKADNSSLAAVSTAVGDLSQLTTEDESSLVGAVNEVNGKLPKNVYIEKEWRTSHEFAVELNSVYMLYTDSDETVMKIRIYQTGSLNKWTLSGSAISNVTYSNGKVTVTMAANRGLIAVRIA